MGHSHTKRKRKAKKPNNRVNIYEEGITDILANYSENDIAIGATVARTAPDGRRGGAAPIPKLSRKQKRD
jgi:hypothetical protein